MAGFIDSLVQGTNDKVEIKSQVDLGGQSFLVFKQFIEEIQPVEIATVIQERNLTGAIMIWGNSSFATWGTSLWGGTLPALATVRVIPPNNIFNENFLDETFIALLEDCAVTGEELVFS